MSGLAPFETSSWMNARSYPVSIWWMVEVTISQAAFTLGMRRTPHRRLAKTHLHHVAIAAAINVSRMVNWLLGEPLYDA